MKMRLTLALAALLLVTGTIAQAQQIVQARGVDSRVDYESLTKFGPWDDRNYDLNADDLEFLAPNEAELSLTIPAFFRVKMRQHNPDMRREGPVQYPLSAPEIFRQMFGGFLIDGKIYNRTTRDEEGVLHVIVDDSGVVEKDFFTRRESEFEALVSGEARVTPPGSSAESAVAIHPTDPNKVIAGVNGAGGQIMHFSSDGGATWTASAALPLGATCCDPTVEWSTDGTTAITTTLGNCGFAGCDVWAYRTGDDGATWTDFATGGSTDPRREIATGGGHDKQFLHLDRIPTSPHFGKLYMTWHNGNVLQNAVSTDNGETWSTVAFSAAGPELGVGSDVSSDAAGNVYVAWPAFNSSDILIRKSTDGGATFPTTVKVDDTFASFNFALPSQESRGVAVIVSTDADTSSGPFADSIYVGWTDSTAITGAIAADNHGRVRVAYSRDGGATWTPVTVHPTGDAATVDRWQGWAEVDEAGNVHVIFNSTINDPTRTGIDVYHVVSTDGGVTYSTPERLTAVTSPNITDGFEFGDYSSMSVAMTNAMAIYTDNRNEAGGGGNSIDVYVSGFQTDGIAADIFDDGFETGDTSLWDVTVP